MRLTGEVASFQRTTKISDKKKGSGPWTTGHDRTWPAIDVCLVSVSQSRNYLALIGRLFFLFTVALHPLPESHSTRNGNGQDIRAGRERRNSKSRMSSSTTLQVMRFNSMPCVVRVRLCCSRQRPDFAEYIRRNSWLTCGTSAVGRK